MYTPSYFTESDEATLLQFAAAHPFAMIMGCAQQIPVATQVSLLIEKRDGQTLLKGHIMRQTNHHKAFQQNANVLCLFAGPHAYVSASWYQQPKQASTWNYMSVQASGALQFLTEDETVELLRQTTTHFESPNSAAAFENLPAAYVRQLVKAIAGFEIAVARWQGTFKLSQNRDAESYAHIVQQLQNGDANAQAVAHQMQLNKTSLFPTG